MDTILGKLNADKKFVEYFLNSSVNKKVWQTNLNMIEHLRPTVTIKMFLPVHSNHLQEPLMQTEEHDTTVPKLVNRVNSTKLHHLTGNALMAMVSPQVPQTQLQRRGREFDVGALVE